MEFPLRDKVRRTRYRFVDVDGDYQVAARSLLRVAVAGDAVRNGGEVEGLVLIETEVGAQFVGPVGDIGERPAAKKARHLGLCGGRQVALRYLRDDAVASGSPRMRGRGEHYLKEEAQSEHASGNGIVQWSIHGRFTSSGI